MTYFLKTGSCTRRLGKRGLLPSFLRKLDLVISQASIIILEQHPHQMPPCEIKSGLNRKDRRLGIDN